MRTQIHKPKSGVGLVLTDAAGGLHVCQNPDELWTTVLELMEHAEEEPEESAPAPRKRRARDDDGEEESSADEDMIAGLASSVVGELFRKAQGASFRGRKGTG